MEQFDCRSCGACCISENGKHHIEISERDVLRFAPRTRKMHVLTTPVSETEQRYHLRVLPPPATPQMFVDSITCSLLEGAIGDGCKCSVYNQRPQACRDLEPGSKACLKAREGVGL